MVLLLLKDVKLTFEMFFHTFKIKNLNNTDTEILVKLTLVKLKLEVTSMITRSACPP